MNWHAKPIATMITGLVTTLYLGAIFCEEMDYGGKNQSKSMQVVDIKLSFSNSPESNNTEKNQQNLSTEAVEKPSEPIKKMLVREVAKPVVPIKKVQKRLIATPVEETPPVKKIELVKQKNKVKPNENDREKNSKRTTVENISEILSAPAQVKNISSIASTKNVGVGSAMQDYMAQVRHYIAKQKRYPKEAKIRRHQGKVTVSFVIDASGRVSQTQIVKKCQSRFINKSVKVLLSKLRFNAAPDIIKEQFPKTVILDVNYQFG